LLEVSGSPARETMGPGVGIVPRRSVAAEARRRRRRPYRKGPFGWGGRSLDRQTARPAVLRGRQAAPRSARWAEGPDRRVGGRRQRPQTQDPGGSTSAFLRSYAIPATGGPRPLSNNRHHPRGTSWRWWSRFLKAHPSDRHEGGAGTFEGRVRIRQGGGAVNRFPPRARPNPAGFNLMKRTLSEHQAAARPGTTPALAVGRGADLFHETGWRGQRARPSRASRLYHAGDPDRVARFGRKCGWAKWCDISIWGKGEWRVPAPRS